jgi:uncharacterized protein
VICRKQAWVWRVLLALLLAVCVVSCGVKGPPLPAVELIPAAPGSPDYEFRHDGLLAVGFRPPLKTVSGRPLRDLGGFYVDKSENKIDPGFCFGCPVAYTSRIRIPAVKSKAGRLVMDAPYEFEDRLRTGYAYRYRIMAHNSRGEYDPSEFQVLTVNYDEPTQAPVDLDVKTEDRLVFLNWSPPEKLIDGRPVEDLVGYDVYRRQGEETWQKINGIEPMEQAFFRDDQVENGREYEYQVRAVRDFKGTLIAGEPSIQVKARPLDLTPPPPPVKVYAVSAPEGVTLTWPEDDIPDLAGYRVYRRTSRQAEYRRIGPKIIPTNIYVDRSVRTGESYLYYVTSVDRSPAANESEPSPTIRIHVMP